MLLQFRELGELGVQFGDEARPLLDKRVAAVFDFLGADVAAGLEDAADVAFAGLVGRQAAISEDGGSGKWE